MDSFDGRIAVVTGGGTGMGRELTRQLAAAGSSVAICDVSVENMTETVELCGSESDAVVTTHRCDVADETQVLAFRDEVKAQHETDHINLLFNNAGIAGGGSFVAGERDEWETTFGVCWGGVYNCARAFMPLLVASDEAVIVNTSSVNGFWASVGPGVPHTAYSAAKFAVKGFTEALMADLQTNAPHVRAAVVMPGHIGTSIVINTWERLPPDLTVARKRIAEYGLPADQMSDDDLLAVLELRAVQFRDDAPTSAADAATTILEGVLANRWRILVGEDAFAMDELVREAPKDAYTDEFVERLLERGHFGGIAVSRTK